MRIIMRTLRHRWQRFKRWQKIVLMVGLLLLVGLSALYAWIFVGLPPIDQLQAGLALPSTRILDRHGRLLYEIIDPKGGRHTAVPLAQIPKELIQATIATEDKNFYATPGID